MFSKILISGKIEVVTGMHIGTGGEFAAIGAVDSPVIRDKVTNLPIIPGSSIKGKMRSVLAKKYSPDRVSDAADDCDIIKRVFGSSEKNKAKPARAVFSDLYLVNMDDMRKMNIDNPTEVKFENTINRLTGVANPRQIERVIRGSVFNLEIIYNIDNEAEAKEDLELICEGIKMLSYDYIGGHGSRGYGRVKFNGLSAEAVIGEPDDELLESVNNRLKEV